MNLRAQLLLIAALALALPWAGCEYIRQTELGLRTNERDLLALTAASVASSLALRHEGAFAAAAPDQGTLYLAPLQRAPTLDGYASDWLPARAPEAFLSGTEAARLLAGEHDATAYLYVQIPGSATRLTVFARDRGGQLRALTVDPRVRGGSRPTVTPRATGGAPVDVVVEPGNRVFNVEVRLPLALSERGLGVRVDGAADATLAQSFAGAAPSAPARQRAAVAGLLEQYADAGLALYAIDRHRRIVAQSGSGRAARSTPQSASVLPPRLLRWILDEPAPASTVTISAASARGALIEQALSGEAQSIRVATPDPLSADVVAVAPVRAGTTIRGAVVATRRSAAELLATNAALQRLALITVALTIGTIVLLAGYAGWLSLRIRRLARATDAAMDARGQLSPAMPGSRGADEIGDLARSVEALLGRVRDHNDYLKALAGRLSHELATPLSVVSSSLDNLEAARDDERSEFTGRARDGVERLRGVLSAMREATRIEDVVANATYADLDLAELLNGVVAGYRSAYAEHRFDFVADPAPLRVRAAPALLVQLLDKLIDNATSFAPDGSTIELSAQRRGAAAVVALSNTGPTLTDEQQATMFSSLVSYRREGGGMHMGFGLYIAALIAAGHGGRLAARNRDDDSGVVIEMLLPLR